MWRIEVDDFPFLSCRISDSLLIVIFVVGELLVVGAFVGLISLESEEDANRKKLS